MSFCVNINSNEFKTLLKDTGLDSFSLELKVKSWQISNGIDAFPTAKEVLSNSSQSGIGYNLKATSLIMNNLDKVNNWFKQMKNTDIFWNKIQKDLGIPKEQVELLKNSKGNTIEDKLLNFTANYSYAVEINTTKDERVLADMRFEGELPNTNYYQGMTVPGGTNYTENEISTPLITPSIKGHAQFSTDNGIGWFRSDDKQNKILGWKEEDDFLNSETAQYTPIVKDDKIIFGHPGIGKTYLKESGRKDIIDFDSDYKTKINEKFNLPKGFKARNDFQKSNKEEYQKAVRELWIEAKQEAKRSGRQLFASDMILLREFANDFDKVITMSKDTFVNRAKQRNDYTEGETEKWKTSLDAEISKIDKSKVINTDKYLSDLLEGNPKTRRILEVQSDLFQKGRDKKNLISYNEFNEYKESNFTVNGKDYSTPGGGYFFEDGENIDRYRFIAAYRDFEDTLEQANSENQFLQLLNKDNNWVTFFIKSIIQDSAKKGYEKVLFPSGKTVSKIEQFDKIIEKIEKFNNKIKTLENSTIDDYEKTGQLSGDVEVYKRKDNQSLGYTTLQISKDFTFEDNIKESIDKLKKDKSHYENTEKQRLGTINFYENTVTNILNKTYGKEQDYSNTPIKNGVDNLFEENKELSKIGSKEKYSKYLDTIFPDSKVKDIVYHGSPSKHDIFKTIDENAREERFKHTGAMFTSDKNYTTAFGENLYNVILNIKNPEILSNNTGINSTFVATKYYSEWKNKGKDGVIGHDALLDLDHISDGTEYVVFEPEQIHILGSKQDIEGFKDFVKESSKPKVSQITDEYGNTWNEIEVTDKNIENILFQKEKTPNDIQKLGKRFNIQSNGFFSRNVNIGELRNQATKLGLQVKETSNKQGYYLVKDGKMVNAFYQESTKGLKKIDPKKEAEIISKVKNFLQKAGITTINVEAIKDANGNTISAIGVAKLLSKIIEVVENKADVTTLTEEAAHFFTLMLKDNALLEKMILDIDQYDVYKEVTESAFYKEKYKNNERLLRIEAVGKQIVKSIIKQETTGSEKLDTTFKRFWNNILNKIKSLFSRVSIEDKKSLFDIAAQDILSGDISKLDTDKKIDLNLYQESNKQSEVIDALENKFNLSYNEDITNSKTGKKGVYQLSTSEGLKKIENRVSDDVEAINKKRGFTERTTIEKAQDEVRRVVGVAGHADINNIITRIVENINGVETTSKVTSLDDVSYNELEKYFQEFMKEFPAGSKFYTEKIIYDEYRNQAGTIDLLVILPNGKAEIYDWKFVEFKQKDSSGKVINKSVAWYKEENYNVQLTRYRQILRTNYGVTEFGKTRVIPIKANYKKNKLQSLEIGNTKIDNIDKTYLDPISISGLVGGEVEFTDDAKINAMLETLLQQRKRILDKSESTAEGKIKKSERLERINNSIKKLQVEGDIKSFLDDAVFELNYIVNVGIENLNNDDLVKAKELVDYYSDLLKDGKLPDDQKTTYTQVLSRVVLNSQDLYSKISEEYEKRIKETASNVGVTNPFELQPESGLLARLFRSISQNNHPLVKTFYKILTKQRDKVYEDTKKLNEQISEKLENLKKWGDSKGISGFDIYIDLLQYDKDGNWTGKLINQWDSEYYRLKDLAIANKDFDWVGENCTFDSEKYQQYFEKNKAIWEQMYKGETDGELKLKRRIEEFEMKFNGAKHNTAILNKSNRFIHPKEIWRSKEWKKLQKPENKPLKDFYELFKGTIDEFREYLPIDLEGNFIPNIKNDLMDQITQNGLDSISGLGESIIQHLESGSDETVGMIDEITGEKIKTVPLLYTNKLDSKSKSKDLGKVLSLFGNMAYNYKYMSEIESSSNMLKDLLGSQKQLITTANGKKLKSKVTGELASAIGNSETLEQLNDYINYYIYGIKTKGKDAVFKFGDKELSGQKTFSKTLMYYSTKSLSLNLLSGLANGLGGISNAFFEGIKGRFYSNREFSKSLAMLASKNNMAYSAMEFWDIDSTNNDFKKSNKLSISKVTKNMTMDKFFILQHGGDFVIENGVLLSMLQSHTLKDGKIVKKSKEEKSLLELSSNSKDFKLDNLTDEEYQKFRRKVKYIYSTIKGNTNPEDVNSIKMTVLGQAVMQFRGWIPRMADERFGELRYTEDLETYEMGKYRSFWNQTINKQILPNIFTALAQGGVLGIGANSINSKSVTQKAIQLYNDAKYKNPDLKITQAEFIELHKQNLRSTALELQIILAITLLLVGLKGMDDDDDKDSVRKVAMKILQRNLAEISFFADPDSTTSILKKPIPILSFASDITDFISDLTGEVVGHITDDEKRIKKNKPARKFNKIFPVTNALENFWALADPDYNR